MLVVVISILPSLGGRIRSRGPGRRRRRPHRRRGAPRDRRRRQEREWNHRERPTTRAGRERDESQLDRRVPRRRRRRPRADGRGLARARGGRAARTRCGSTTVHLPFGGEALMRFGHPLPLSTRQAYRNADAILVSSPDDPALDGVVSRPRPRLARLARPQPAARRPARRRAARRPGRRRSRSRARSRSRRRGGRGSPPSASRRDWDELVDCARPTAGTAWTSSC